MSIGHDPQLQAEDGYDEEADSDFQGDDANDEDISSSSGDDAEANDPAALRPRKRQKTDSATLSEHKPIELDSGDEATIKEQKKARRRQKKKGEDLDGDSDNEESGWRAKTRSMRDRERDEKKHSKLANITGSTIDVDKAWEEMNRPGPLPSIRVEGTPIVAASPSKKQVAEIEQNKENIPALSNNEEMITIKRKFKFAGEVHVEEKVVPKSSAEARLWLAQQETKPQSVEETGTVVHRPLRKISRFDPNYNNLEAFKMNWSRSAGGSDSFKGPKLNVVEKSKMDWASHVDAEGLKEELDEHAKAKEGYHGRMEFLSQVEQRKEEEARQARMKR